MSEKRKDAAPSYMGERESLLNTSDVKSQYRASLYLSYVVQFVMFLDMFIIMPSIWPYVKSLGGNEGLIGWVLAAFSLTNFFAAPILSVMAAKGSFRMVLLISTFICLVGNIVYALGYHWWVLILGRAIAGIGSGSIGVGYGYVAQVTSEKNSNKEYSKARAFGNFGLAMGPGIGAVFSFVPEYRELTVFSMPAYFTSLLCAILFILILFMFKDPEHVWAEPKLKSYVTGAINVCLLASFATAFCMSAYQTYATPETATKLHWSIADNGLFFMLFGIAFMPGVLLSYVLSTKISERFTLMAGLVCFIIGLVVDWGGRTSWWRFILSASFICLGYSLSSTILPVLFAKLLPPQHRAVQMSWIPAVGGAARLFGPVYGGQMFYHFGDFYAELGMACLILVVGIVCAIFYRQFVPSKYVAMEDKQEQVVGDA